MRCLDCEKFVSFDTEQEPEPENEPSLEADGTFTASYRRVLACGECGGELKAGSVSVEGEVTAPVDSKCAGGAEHAWSLASCDATPSVGRRAYGVVCTVTAACGNCDVEVVDIEFSGEVASKDMEEQV